jgi:hypothetical protein
MKRISSLLRGIGLIAGLCGVAAPFTMADLIADWGGNYVTAANNKKRSTRFEKLSRWFEKYPVKPPLNPP